MATPKELDALLARAMNAHQAGRLADAQNAYQALIKAAPRHFPALHFLGLVHFQKGEPDRAISLLRKALAIKPARHDFRIAAGAAPAVGRHMSVTGG